jgi:hypothetical protein
MPLKTGHSGSGLQSLRRLRQEDHGLNSAQEGAKLARFYLKNKPGVAVQACNPTYSRGSQSEASLGKNTRLYLKN